MRKESYTSKASFWDKDVIPVYKSDDTEEYHFSGKRIHRGQYRTASGQVLNADVNGALNIMRKSSVVDAYRYRLHPYLLVMPHVHHSNVLHHIHMS